MSPVSGYDEAVEVRRGETQSPEQFLWRGRLWQVREVLVRPVGRREVWRVRAARGRLAGALHDSAGEPGSGVFDLDFDWSTGDWRLAGVVAP
jgi:hypothetical protein